MKSLEELLLLWQEGNLTEEELAGLKTHLGSPEGRARLADDLLTTAVIVETLKVEDSQAAADLEPGVPEPAKSPAADAPRLAAAPDRRVVFARLAVAALLLIAIGAGTWMFFRPGEAHGSETLIEQLVEWNLHLSEAPTPDERQRIYQAQHAQLQDTLANARLSVEERDLAQLLLETGNQLAAADDPVAAAEGFSIVADTLADRLKAVAVREDQPAFNRFTHLHNLVIARGVAASLKRAGSAQGQDRLGARLETPGAAIIDQLGLPAGQGLVVRHVAVDSPAAKAGIQEHDILLELAGKPVWSDPGPFAKALAEIKANEPVAALVLRKGHKIAVMGMVLPAAAPLPAVPPLAKRLFVAGPGGKGQSTVAHRDDGFSAFHQDEGLFIRMNADVVDGRISDLHITVMDGSGIHRFDRVAEVPDRYRAAVQHLTELGLKKRENPAPAPGGRGRAPAEVLPLSPPERVAGVDGNGQTTIVPGDDGFTAIHRDGTLLIVVKADRVNGKSGSLNIILKDETGFDTFGRLDEVPAKHRPVVGRLIELGQGKVEPNRIP